MRSSLLLSLGACVAAVVACGSKDEEPGGTSGGTSSGDVSSSSGSLTNSSSGAASSSSGSGTSSGGSSSSGGGQCGESEFCATLCGTAPYSGCGNLEGKCTCYSGACLLDADAGADAGTKCGTYGFGECKDFGGGTTLCAIPPGSPFPH